MEDNAISDVVRNVYHPRKYESRPNMNGSENHQERRFHNIDLSNLKNVINVVSEGNQNAVVINICEQQNIINFNPVEVTNEKNTEYDLPPEAFNPSFLPQIAKRVGLPNHSLFIPRDKTTSFVQDCSSRYVNPRCWNEIEKQGEANLEYRFPDYAKILNTRQNNEVKYQPSRYEIEYHPLEEDEHTRMYLLRKNPTEHISISKAITQLPNLPKTNMGLTGLKCTNLPTISPSMTRRRRTIEYSEKVMRKNRQFIQSNLNTSITESENKLKASQNGKSYDQWKAEKANAEKKKKKEQEQKEKEKVHCDLKSEERKQLNEKKYNDWLLKKHQKEIAKEEKLIDDMRSKWAAKGVSHSFENKQLCRGRLKKMLS